MGTVQRQSVAPGRIRVRHCHGMAEFERCLEVQKRVWGGSDLDVVPLPVFVVTAETGGQVLGAFDGPEDAAVMVGFTLAFPGVRESRPFLHSHMTAVLPDYQNRGIGHRLKLTQRRGAIRRGIELVEWTFDPLELRNAHFNLVRLGAIVRRFLPNHYGITTSPLHAGLPTDRLLAEWWLRSPRVEATLAGKVPARVARPTGRPGARVPVRIAVPRNIGELKTTNREEAARVQRRVREEFRRWLARGYVVTSLEMGEKGGHYVLEPRSPAMGIEE